MKKKIIVFLSCVFIFLVAILFTFNNYYASKEVIINEKNSYLNTDNMMSMMYETASGSGEYMVAVITLGRRRDMFLMKDFLVAKMVVNLFGMMKEKQLLYLQMYLTNAIFILINIM